ncbi:MAG: hypothetical protein ACTSYA_09915 [Candidatus Kariarchaeaceae archaeon]
MKYTLPKNYYLENLDNRNWIVYKNFKDKNGKIKKDIKGFYPTLKMAVDSAIDMFALKAEDLSDLKEMIEDLKELKKLPFNLTK